MVYGKCNMSLRWGFNMITIRNTHRRWWRTGYNQKGFEWLDWPAYLPDLNPIGQLFSILNRYIGSKPFSNRKKLFSCLEDEWKRIDPKIIDNLIKSMPRRCAAARKIRVIIQNIKKFLRFCPGIFWVFFVFVENEPLGER